MKKYAFGYTIVELLVSITITAFLISIGLSAYRQSQNRQAVQAASETILSALNAAQKEASSGTNNCSGVYLGQRVSIISGTNEINVQAVCEGGIDSPTRYSIGENDFYTSNSFLFQPLSNGVDLGGAAQITIGFTSTYGQNFAVSVSQDGAIRYLGAQ